MAILKNRIYIYGGIFLTVLIAFYVFYPDLIKWNRISEGESFFKENKTSFEGIAGTYSKLNNNIIDIIKESDNKYNLRVFKKEQKNGITVHKQIHKPYLNISVDSLNRLIKESYGIENVVQNFHLDSFVEQVSANDEELTIKSDSVFYEICYRKRARLNSSFLIWLDEHWYLKPRFVAQKISY